MQSNEPRPARRPPVRRSVAVVAVVAAWSVTVAVLLVFVSSMTHLPVPPVVIAAQGSVGPLIAAATFVAVVAGYRRRPHLCRMGAAVAALLLADLVTGVLAAHHDRAPADTAELRIVVANLLWENEQVAAAAADLAHTNPDVLVTVETLARFEPAITEAFGGALVPVARQPDTSTPVVVWARPWLDPTRRAPVTSARLPSVEVTTRAGRSILVVGVHLESPELPGDVDEWRRQLDELAHLSRGANGPAAPPAIIAGDFNASLSHPGMRDVLTHATDAARASGWLWAPSWPTGPSRSIGFVPPVRMLDIDHVLVTGPLAVAGFARTDIVGSDHAAVRADVAYLQTG